MLRPGTRSQGPASFQDALSCGVVAFRQLSLGKAAEEPAAAGWTQVRVRVRVNVGEAALVEVWLGVDEGEETCSSSWRA